MISTGLCFLSSCFPRRYFLVTKKANNTEALSYCRTKYTDLASVHNEQDIHELQHYSNGTLPVWIGLQADTEAWTWSLENPSYYGEGENGFRSWHPGQRDGSRHHKMCTTIRSSGWVYEDCTLPFNFICYDGKNSHTSSS